MSLVDQINSLASRMATEFKSVRTAIATKVDKSTTISAGTGLTGGGALDSNQSLAVNFGTTAGTVTQGNDSRLSNARTPTAHTHLWADITDKPSTFTPSAHTHTKAQISDFAHTHVITDLPVAASGVSNTTSLVRADDSRLSNARTPTSHTHLWADITDKPSTFTPSTHTHTKAQISDFAHSHLIADLPVAASGVSSSTALVRADDARLSNNRTPVAHSHVWADITGKPATYPPDSHTHPYLSEDSTPAALWKAQSGITGGGIISVSSGGLFNWTARFIVISHGRGAHFSTAGYFDITRPADGTVVTGVGGAANYTVAGGIQLNVWQALYYILPIGGASGSVAGNFRLVNYTADVVIPDNWLLLAVRNGDSSGPVRVCTGPQISLGSTSTGNDPYPQYAVSNLTRVTYTTSVPARPAGAVHVEWVGQVDPGANALANDTWIPTA